MCKITPFWTYVDLNKSAFIKRMSEPGFALESLVDPAVSRYGTETGGEDWEHLSPGCWRYAGCHGQIQKRQCGINGHSCSELDHEGLLINGT